MNIKEGFTCPLISGVETYVEAPMELIKLFQQ